MKGSIRLFVIRLLLPSIIFLCRCQLCCSATTELHRISYIGTMGFRPSTVADGNACVRFDAFATAGGFFQGLVSEEKQGKVQFRRGSERPAFFPEDMEVEIDVSTMPCSSAARLQQFSSIPTFINSVSFAAEWTGPTGPVKASLVLIDEEKSQWSELTPRKRYRFRLLSKKIPLTEQLTIWIHFDGRLIGNLAGAVSVPTVRALRSSPQVIYRLHR